MGGGKVKDWVRFQMLCSAELWSFWKLPQYLRVEEISGSQSMDFIGDCLTTSAMIELRLPGIIIILCLSSIPLSPLLPPDSNNSSMSMCKQNKHLDRIKVHT